MSPYGLGTLHLDHAQADDIAWMAYINDAAIPAVSPANTDTMRQLMDLAGLAVIGRGNARSPLGFALVMSPNSDYASDNYRWFAGQYDRFAYIDRIVVAHTARGRGVGRTLYAAIANWACEHGFDTLTCEVNEHPPNPQSMAFHRALGFSRIHARMSDAGKQVAMMVKPLRSQPKTQPKTSTP